MVVAINHNRRRHYIVSVAVIMLHHWYVDSIQLPPLFCSKVTKYVRPKCFSSEQQSRPIRVPVKHCTLIYSFIIYYLFSRMGLENKWPLFGVENKLDDRYALLLSGRRGVTVFCILYQI